MPDLRVPPLPFDAARVARIFEALAGQGFVPDAPARALLEGVFGNSPYLGRLAVREPEALKQITAAGPLSALEAAIARACAVALLDDEGCAMAELRGAKRAAALAIALADIGGLWALEEVTGALTRFADACVQGALRFLLRRAATQHGMAEQDGAVLEATTGLTVLAMGKYGAHELNYSSDIDLVVFYDAERFPFAKRGDGRGAAVDIVRGLVKLIAETTADGYVFRTDLRLRPDAGATQVAISLEAAEDYYESLGQNWERAAMIKARPCAGDPQTGAAFQAAIMPFIWRRNLDFAAIEDIQSIKRQIHAHAGHGDDRGGRPQYQAGPWRHPRDRIFRPDPATHPGRAPSRSARARHPGIAGGACGAWHHFLGNGGRSCPRLPVSADAGTSPADDRGRADPYRAEKRRGRGACRLLHGSCKCRRHSARP